MSNKSGTRPGTILHLPRRQFTKYDSTVEHSKDQIGIIIDMPKRYRLGIKALGDHGPKGVESPEALADYCNKKLKRNFFNRHHMSHLLKQLAKAKVVLPPSGNKGWHLAPNGEAVYNRTKKIPLNNP